MFMLKNKSTAGLVKHPCNFVWGSLARIYVSAYILDFLLRSNEAYYSVDGVWGTYIQAN